MSTVGRIVPIRLDQLDPIATGHDYGTVGKVSVMVSILDRLDPGTGAD